MALIDLNNSFPEPPGDYIPSKGVYRDDTGVERRRGPLPKQLTFLNSAIDTAKYAPKYIRYVGGIGSGKTLIGCITILCMAIQAPGDYLIARQFMPELKVTTYKQFKEICPPELIIDDRIADMEIHIRTAAGKRSIIYFKGLDDWDKLRSMNLNAFYIDEANQVAEAAFELLQGRLRGKYWRKGLITQNSGGHDWSWRWFVKKDMIKNEALKPLFVNIIAPSTENIHLPDGYVETMLGTWSEDRIQREIYANEDSFEGQVYHEFRQDIHVIRPFAIPDSWTRVIGVDHGYRNPAAWIWGAVDHDGNVFIYREFYQREWDIEEICKGKKILATGRRDPEKKGVVDLMKTGPNRWETIDQALIDPATKAMRGKTSVGSKGQKIESEYDEYRDNLPDWLNLTTANNEKATGIDRVKQYLKVNPKTGKPSLFIFSTCPELIEEMVNYRWAELPITQQGKKNEKEEPVKYKDHALDALRYLIMSRPELTVEEPDWYEKNKIAYGSLEGKLHRDIQEMVSPTPVDPLSDY